MSDHQAIDAREARAIVWARQGSLCARCWQPMHSWSWEAHHRQRRRESVAGWCPCNVVGLHPRCHTQGITRQATGLWAVHDEPELARAHGLIVPSWAPNPADVPTTIGWPWQGSAYLDHEGMVVSGLEKAAPTR